MWTPVLVQACLTEMKRESKCPYGASPSAFGSGHTLKECEYGVLMTDPMNEEKGFRGVYCVDFLDKVFRVLW